MEVLPLKPVKIMDNYKSGNKLLDVNAIIGSMNFTSSYSEVILKYINLMKIICLPRILTFNDPRLSAEMILKLLSPYTKKFQVIDLSYMPNLLVSDIIKKAPNLESIEIHNDESNIIYEKTWIEDLLKYKNGKNFTNLDVILGALEFDVENFVKFVETKCSKSITIKIWFRRDLLNEDNEAYNLIIEKLSKYFDSKNVKDSWLMIGFPGGERCEMFSLNKIKHPKGTDFKSEKEAKSNWKNLCCLSSH
uniref:Uncharacterized protein n=1 Tax=Panagrolaimus sp. ES5 TaxID=591445 RepID=A0AC34FBH6_9BILA